jgi:hypothetical protein
MLLNGSKFTNAMRSIFGFWSAYRRKRKSPGRSFRETVPRVRYTIISSYISRMTTREPVNFDWMTRIMYYGVFLWVLIGSNLVKEPMPLVHRMGCVVRDWRLTKIHFGDHFGQTKMRCLCSS